MATAPRADGTPSTPLGIKIICVLGALGGVLGVVNSLAAFGVSPILGVFSLVLSIGQLVVVLGLWNLRSWAWTVAMVVYGLSIALSLVSFDVVGLLVGLIIVAYLLSKRHLFS